MGLKSFILLAFLCLGTGTANAAATAESEHVKIKLIAEKAAVSPGDKVTVAIIQDIIPHWHVYWQNPGDSGMAPSVTWTLPPGYTEGAIQWPAPSRIEYGPLVNFGYADHVTFLVDIDVPKTAVIGSVATIQLALNYLVCSEICIPENAHLDVAVPVAALSKPVLADAAIFAAARAQLPHSAPFSTDVTVDPSTIVLSVIGQKADKAFFFPDKPGLIDNAAPQEIDSTDKGFTLTIKRGDLRSQPLTQLSGILRVTPLHDKISLPYAIMATAPAAGVAKIVPAASGSRLTIISALALALVGGIVLNLMPCVFPVLSLKVLSLSHHVHSDRQTISSGIFYMLGILAAFALVAISLLALRSAGHAVGWGFQLQSPTFVLCLAYVLFAMGLSLSGLFEITPSFLGFGQQWAAHHGNAGSFFTGALAALVATPCTAPFMGAALGFAMLQPAPVAFGIIEMLGLGLGLPYVLATFYPQAFKFLPRPGVWMQHIKQFLAFPLYGSAVWLVWVLSLQSGPNSVLIALGGAMLLAFAAWVYSSSRDARPRWRPLFTIIAGLAVLAALATLESPLITRPTQKQANSNAFIPTGWESFSDARLTQLQQADKPVFIDMSAAWCITCMLNERVALGSETVTAMQQQGITLLKGDWTNQDPEITRLLAAFGRNGVPLYVYYPGGNRQPVVLPQILTPATVLKAIGHA
jgi:thiol:disulfide interchange protein DsbD